MEEKSQFRDRDFGSSSLDDETETRSQDRDWERDWAWMQIICEYLQTKQIHSMEIGHLFLFMHDLSWYMHDYTDIPYNVLTVNLQDSKTKDVETETFQDWIFWELSRPILFETKKFKGCCDRDRPRLSKSSWDLDFF